MTLRLDVLFLTEVERPGENRRDAPQRLGATGGFAKPVEYYFALLELSYEDMAAMDGLS